jgi:phage tail sheath protein FI
MTLGTDDNEPTAAEINVGLDFLADSETVDVNLMFAYPDANGTNTIADKLISICKTRKDCMAFVSPPIEDSVGTSTPAADVKAWADTLVSTSYASADSGAVYVYDKYNDTYRWLGASGLCAGLCANTDNVADAWFSPAGTTRGQLFGVAKLAYNPKKVDRDTLYKARVNPLVSFPGQGTMMFGDKTLLSKPSAFDRINVRRLFIVLEKAISTAAKGQLFEFNDEFTRAQFRNLLEPFLRDVKGRRGVTDFRVVCDATNNTGQVIDANRFVADIFIKPSRSINFISLNFIATRTGVDFSEIAGS